MKHPIDRREFLKLAGLGSVVFASSLGVARAAGTMAAAKGGTYDDFYFVQLSDTHWGFEGPPNPDAKGTGHAVTGLILGVLEIIGLLALLMLSLEGTITWLSL